MKLSYRGINHDFKTTTLKTDIVGNGKYRGANFNLHSSATAKRNKPQAHLVYRGIHY